MNENEVMNKNEVTSENEAMSEKEVRNERSSSDSEPRIPLWEKYALTIEEAADYFNIGRNRIRELIREPGCMYVLYVGRRTLIKRKEFEKELNMITYI